MFPAPSEGEEEEEEGKDRTKLQAKLGNFWDTLLFNNQQPSEGEGEPCERGVGRIPNKVLEELSSCRLKLPFQMAEETGGLTLRYMRKRDIDGVLQLILDEFGPLPPTVDKNLLGQLQYAYESWSFSVLVRCGLLQRLETLGNDHAVLCLTTPTPDEKVVAMAELSLQPPDPYNVAPPYVLPYWMKQILCVIRQTGTRRPTPYLSNVLVAPRHRRRGYGRVLVAACEGLAQEWILESSSSFSTSSDEEMQPHISLHVDADPFTGRGAQRLYGEFGYRVVANSDRQQVQRDSQYQWMQKATETTYINGGLHIIEGIPLLYLRKRLDLQSRDKENEQEDGGEP